LTLAIATLFLPSSSLPISNRSPLLTGDSCQTSWVQKKMFR
jgi:hypothetical protein